MSGPVVAAIIMRSIGDIEVAHEFAEIAKRRLGQNVPMIVHQHKTVQDDAIGTYRLREDTQKLASIHIILKNSLTFIATVGDMIQRAGKLNS